MVVEAYFDESGHSADSSVVAVAGIAAPVEIWRWFDRAWQALLEAGGISHFHMVQLENRRGEFADWTEDFRHAFLQNLIQILRMPDFFPFGIAFLMEDWNAMPQWRREWFKDPYATGVSIMMQIVAGSFSNLDKLNFVFDRIPRLTGAANDASDFARSEARPKGIIGSFRFASSQDTLPLQAADFIAYEFGKYARNRVSDPERPVRWTMEKLAEGNCSFFGTHLSDDEDFERWL